MASTVDELDLYEKYLALSDKLRIAEEDKTKWVCDKVATALTARDKQIELEKERIELDRECYEKCAREACHTARDALRLVQQKSRDRQLPRSALKVFSTNDPVLVLLPDANNKLQMRLRGPFKIIDRISSVNYRVQIDNRIVTLHVNLLRRYYPREVDNLESSTPEPKEALTFAAMSALIEEEDTTWVKPTVYTGPELGGC
ncbi:hypothetical protein PoB_004311000 [Plakobranchus ocellatus]|uniref:Tf2-1-like SH3-like domain-containing protein n=1 Tax=Plakobranchus ocellatus TaxID=259542 RepID=A0AAV4BBZ0_9GAST|nr:hypothetical protein PoB_004311000 [Plakobranchus ocellatus]